MTVVIKNHKNENYYISLSLSGILYTVGVYPVLPDNYVGYPIREKTYSIYDRKLAVRTYNRYKKKYIG